MTDEQKKGILQLKLMKPGITKPQMTTPTAPVDPTVPVDPTAPVDPKEEKVQPVMAKINEMLNVHKAQVVPEEQVTVPAQPAVPEPIGEVMTDGVPSSEEKAFSILQEVQQAPIQSENPKQLIYAKSEELTRRLLTEIGMTVTEAEKLFNVKGKGFTSLFAKKEG